MTQTANNHHQQISVKERHKSLLRFLWFDDPFEKPRSVVKMRFCRIIFGVTCSQYLLTSTIQFHGDPGFCRKVKSHFYVDDLNTRVKSVDSGILLYKK